MENSISGALSASTIYYGLLSSKLSATAQKITVNTYGARKLTFKPEDVIALKRRRFGLQFIHNNSDYPSFIVFWGNPKKIMAIIDAAGFKPTARENQYQDDEYQLYAYLFLIWIIFSISLIALVTLFILLST